MPDRNRVSPVVFSEEQRITSRRKIKFQGEERTAIEIEFEPEKESFSTYALHDGTTLKLKLVLTEVMRIEGAYAPNGDPIYMIQASQIMAVSAPDALERRTIMPAELLEDLTTNAEISSLYNGSGEPSWMQAYLAHGREVRQEVEITNSPVNQQFSKMHPIVETISDYIAQRFKALANVRAVLVGQSGEVYMFGLCSMPGRPTTAKRYMPFRETSSQKSTI